MKKLTFLLLALAALCPVALTAGGAEPAAAKVPATRPASRPTTQPALPPPTFADVAYGKHAKQVLHFWKAESDKPTPLLLFVHGGGWTGGNRSSGLAGLLPEMLKNGISVVSVEYRFIPEATADGVVPPVKGPLHDAARALQFVRSKAGEWNIDKTARRRVRRVRRRLHEPVAGVPPGPGRPQKRRPDRPRIDPPAVRRRQRRRRPPSTRSR